MILWESPPARSPLWTDRLVGAGHFIVCVSQNPCNPFAGTNTKQKDPPFGRRVVPVFSVGMKPLHLLVCKGPSLWGDFQEPLSQKGFLKLLSFPIFLCRSKERLKKETIALIKQYLYTSKQKHSICQKQSEYYSNIISNTVLFAASPLVL